MNKKSLYFKLSLLGIVALYFGYMLYQQNTEKNFDHARYEQEHSLAELNIYPQDLLFYADKEPNTGLIADNELQKYKDEFQLKYYAPWKQIKPLIEQKDLSSVFDRKSVAYAENLKAWDSVKWNKIKENAALDSYPNSSQAAISLNATPLRAIPSLAPLYLDVNSLSNAYPFDMLQYSQLPLGLPLYISHTSADKTWYFVDSGNASGWVQAKDIAFVNKDFIENWLKSELIAITKENTTLTINSLFHAKAFVGTLLPRKEDKVYVPLKDLNGMAYLYNVELNTENYKAFPLPFNAKEIALLGQEMMGQNYGWGGLNGNRDCSLMLEDLFINFAIHLPRNSALQGNIGHVFSLLDTENKEAEILKIAKPFASFIYKKGHIMLYIGSYEGKALVFHNAWGVVAKNNQRILVGKALVSSLELGSQNPRVDKSKSLLNTIQSVNNL